MCLKLFEMCKMSHFKTFLKNTHMYMKLVFKRKKTILPPVCLLRTLEHELVNEAEFYGLRYNEREQ